MSFLLLGFFTGISLILAIGAQNIFVIEQGLKKKYVFPQKCYPQNKPRKKNCKKFIFYNQKKSKKIHHN